MKKEDIIQLEKLKEKMGIFPKHPRLYPPYKIHWNWDISFKCNYKCSYCEVVRRDNEFNSQIADICQLREVWDRIFDNYWCTHVRFSGGEPTIYPNFIPLLEMLLEKHTVDITTNLSFDLNKFLNKVKPGCLSISASFHPEYCDFESFFEKLKYLHFHGFPSTLSYVGYPPHLDKILEYKKRLEDLQMYFKIIPFIGIYKGKRYPESYDARERDLLEGVASDSKDKYLNDMNSKWFKWRVEKEENIDIRKTKIKFGKLCRMGQMYAKIHPDLTVTRCCAGYHGVDSGKIGKLLDDNFKLYDEPLSCVVEQDCPCFKGMFVGEEENKWEPLWESLDHPVYKLEYMREYAKILKEQGNKK